MSAKAKAFLAVLVMAVAGAVLAYYFTMRWQGPGSPGAMQEQRSLWEREQERLKRQIGDLQDEIALHKEGLVSDERLREVFGKDAADLARAPDERRCEDLAREIQDFFSYLDRRSYMQQAGLEQGTYARYLHVVDALSRNPPLVLEETKDNYSLARNVAHFFRVLGKQNVLLIRQILAEEPEVVEPVAGLLYDAAVSTARCNAVSQGGPSLKTAYEYAAFFLNTLAGKSYLLRRDSKVRILTTYYCTLILDRANRETLNVYGIDIRPFIDRSIQDIQSQRGLLFTKKYLDTLEKLKQRYTPR